MQLLPVRHLGCGACLHRYPAGTFTDFVRFFTSEASWKYQGWRLAYHYALNLPCQSCRLRSFEISLMLWCFLNAFFIRWMEFIYIQCRGLTPLTSWAQVENLVERKLHRIYVYLAAWFVFFYFHCICVIWCRVVGQSCLFPHWIWLAYEEREYDGLVSGDMADAIVRRITKRRKQRHLGNFCNSMLWWVLIVHVFSKLDVSILEYGQCIPAFVDHWNIPTLGQQCNRDV